MAAAGPDPLFPLPADTRLPHLQTRLEARYGPLEPRVPWDPLTQLIYSILSSRTKTQESHQVMRDLELAFPGSGPGAWEPVRDAEVAAIERAIARVTFPEAKAPRLKTVLLQITARIGTLTLEPLARYQTEKIRSWLEQFEGVGPQVSAAVVNTSTLRRRALQVDSNHLRVAQRLVLTPRADAATTEERLTRLIPEEWDAVQIDNHHRLVKLHAQTLCTFAEPRCTSCPLLDTCPTGQRNTAEPERNTAEPGR